jgi:hypothetical protein
MTKQQMAERIAALEAEVAALKPSRFVATEDSIKVTPAPAWGRAQETVSKAAARIAAREASNGYSYDSFGPTQWARLAEMLAKRGLTAPEIKGVLRSKYTRWARDSYGPAKGFYKAQVVIDYLDNPSNRITNARIQDLVTEEQ